MSTIHVSVRLDDGTMARVDALAVKFSTEWRAATRSDILRALIHTALELHERGEGPRPPPSSPTVGEGPPRPGRKRASKLDR
jgi:hypothetical protein